MNDPEACIHGRPLEAGCFFCGTKTFTAMLAPREPRNPPAAESRPSLIRRASSQRGAAACHRKRGITTKPQRPPVSAPVQRAVEYLRKALGALNEDPGKEVDPACRTIASVISSLEALKKSTASGTHAKPAASSSLSPEPDRGQDGR